MTSPHQDAADLVAELRARIGMLGPQPEQMLRFMNGMAPLLEKSTNLIEQQAKALSEASQTCNSYSNRALAAEARLAEAMGVIERDIEALTEADTQIEYLHDKFKPTGSGMNALARIDIALTAARAYAAKEKA
jgi:hypothetical protein